LCGVWIINAVLPSISNNEVCPHSHTI
jgi:hypothetical protein